MDHKNIISYIYMETSHVQQDRYDNDNNDMHEGLLDPINIPPLAT